MLEPAVERAATRSAMTRHARDLEFSSFARPAFAFELAERVRGRAEEAKRSRCRRPAAESRRDDGRTTSRATSATASTSAVQLKHAERVRRKVDDAASRRRRGSVNLGGASLASGDFRRDELGTILGRFVDPRWENGENVRRRAIVLDGESAREEERFG